MDQFDQQSAFDDPVQPHWQANDRSDRRNGRSAIAWIIIILIAAIIVLANNLPTGQTPNGSEDPVGVMMMSFQGRYIVGAAELAGNRAELFRQAEALNDGSVPQRQRFIVLAAELAGPDQAEVHLQELQSLIDQAIEESRLELEPEQEAVQEILHTLYGQGLDNERPRIDALDADDRNLLVQELGWYGRLALAPASADDRAARAAVIQPARTMAFAFMGVVVVGIVVGLAGAAGLLVMLVLNVTGNLRSGIAPGQAHHGIYAETFALWLVVFFCLQTLAALAGSVLPHGGMMFAFAGFFASLVALAWPTWRGVSWATVKIDTGLTLGRRPLLEPFIGVAAYVMGLPILAAGAVVTIVLMYIQGMFAGPGHPLDPMGGPAHPIVEELTGPDWWPKIQILLVAAVAAPIVEEIMFRGVLYRHLRDASRRQGMAMSILLSSTLNGFLFAIIHPQGWVAVPVLMSLAYVFALVREWRGTIIPAIIVHAVSNGLVVSMLIAMSQMVR